MGILVYVSTSNNQINKSALEAISYAAQCGDNVTAVQFGEAADQAEAGKFGADKILKVSNAKLNDFQPSLIAEALMKAAEAEGTDTIVLSHDLSGKAVAPILSAKMHAGLVTGAVALPAADGSIKKGVFSGKAYANVKITTAKKIITVTPNSIDKKEFDKTAAVEDFAVEVGDSRLKVVEQKIESADLPLTEAIKVVSAGRGLKGPENWGIIEDLAKELGAATACSRPVSDMDWRPHHEHVGQTGVAIRPNLYIAIGISGAIQHLAGVNQSKVIVVINNDSEAPFFKSADYGIVGDAFEVIPKLIEKAKSMDFTS